MINDPLTGYLYVTDGGGFRGLLSCLLTEYIMSRLNIPQGKFYEHVDAMGGTSTGALQAAAYAYGYDTDTVKNIYLNQGPWLFTERDTPVGCNASRPSNKPNAVQKVFLIGLNEPFYKSACPIGQGDSNFGDNVLQNTLVEKFGNSTMQDLKCPIVIPAYNVTNKTYTFFSNDSTPFFKGQNYKIVDVLRATSAAPVYLPSYTIDNIVYKDGGLFCNNPVLWAMRVAKSRKPRIQRWCIINIGTGLGELGFHGTTNTPEESTIEGLFELYNVAGTGDQESAAKLLEYDMHYTLDQVNILRIQPILDNALVDTELDGTNQETIDYIYYVKASCISENLAQIDDFAARWKL